MFFFLTLTTINIMSFYFDCRTIAYSVSKTRFFVGKLPFVPVTRELPITNTFSFTMIIYDAAFPPEVENVFSVSTYFFWSYCMTCTNNLLKLIIKANIYGLIFIAP